MAVARRTISLRSAVAERLDALATAIELGERYKADLPDLVVMAMSHHRKAPILTGTSGTSGPLSCAAVIPAASSWRNMSYRRREPNCAGQDRPD